MQLQRCSKCFLAHCYVIAMVLWGVTTALLTGPAHDIPVHKAAQLIGIKPKSQYSLVSLIKYMHCLFQSEVWCVLLPVSSS